MASIKATFTLDPETAALLGRMSESLRRSKSEIVRDAILDFGERVDRLSERERAQLLVRFDDLVPKIPERSADEVDQELAELRTARQGGGRGDRSEL